MINSYWWRSKGFWDQHFFIKMLDAPPFQPKKLNGIADATPGEGAVLSIASDLYPQDLPDIQGMLDRMPWVLLLLSSREEAKFPWRELRHPRMRIWVQIPHYDEKLPDGVRAFGHMPHDDLVFGKPPTAEKQMGFFFGGQFTNIHRQRCVHELLRRSPYEGSILTTCGFNQGVPLSVYLNLMAAARVVPCPSGPVTASTFRVFEALECGCLPIADRRCPNDPILYNYWEHMLGYNPPFPTVLEWHDVHEHLDRLKDVEVWKHEMADAAEWWAGYKDTLRESLMSDVNELSET